MHELEVVVDIRENPDAPELIVMRQKIAAEGGELRLVGSPSETRMALATPRVRVTLGELATEELGWLLIAHVRNVSLVPVRITEVAFVYEFEEPPANGEQVAEGSKRKHTLRFGPREIRRRGPLQSGEVRDWYLPPSFRDEAISVADRLPPGKYSVAAYSVNDMVGMLPGEQLKAILYHGPIERDPLLIPQRVKRALADLPLSEQQTVLDAVRLLVDKSPADWPKWGAGPLAGAEEVYSLVISPDLRAFVRRLRSGATELFDLVREETLQRFKETNVQPSMQG